MTSSKVLVLDDDASFANLIADTLRDKGFETEAFASPDEALARLESRSFQAAVVDLVMPGRDGLEVADLIRRSSPDTQVVVLTGHGSKQKAIEGIQHGIFDFLEKASVELPAIERAVRRAVERADLLGERRELQARLEGTNRLLVALHEITTSLARQPHVDRILEGLVDSAKRFSKGAASRAILLTRHEDEWIVSAAAGDRADVVMGTRLQSGEGIGGYVVDRDATLAIDEPREHPRFAERCDELGHAGALICAPLCHRDVRGALYVNGEWDAVERESRRGLIDTLARHAAVAIDNASQHERGLNFFTHVSTLLTSILDGLDTFAAGHSQAVAGYADLMSRRLGLGEDDRRDIHFGALLHDIGKIRLDPALLVAERLTPAQREEMRRHPGLGLELLRPITLWEGVLLAIHFHHERWDGRGYPNGLAGEAIPLGARIVGLAEAFDAMTRASGHAKTRTQGAALAELEACSGSQFDPKLVRLFAVEYRKHGEGLPS